jgi:hypothetical protein
VPSPVTTCTTGSPDQLVGGGQVAPGGCLRSANGGYELVMQTDGNLVLYAAHGQALWASNTRGSKGDYAFMQVDGSLVVNSRSGRVLWRSGPAGHKGAALFVGTGAAIYIATPSGAVIWSSG